MKDYKRGSHTVWDCKYHLVWTTKYRYQVLGGDVGERCRELLREIAMSKEMHIYAGSINRDHVHLLIGIPPQSSVSRAVQYLKGKSSLSSALVSELQKALDDISADDTIRVVIIAANGKAMFYRQLAMDLSEAYAFAGQTMACDMSSEDAREGIDAFIEKRKPVWKEH